ncbi:PIN domain-containing protein [Achromobacter xylosoxidans]|uniref:PIN domain-containing protein n=1 Tax=Alcaligenes xylosoxydans xylosoxydans TaxID=85698 RepID=UPI001F13FB7C|nr:PIN domain-containing protein [Achromobacter xylosoxidans]
MAEEQVRTPAKPASTDPSDVWRVEDSFPVVSNLLLPFGVKAVASDTLLVLDTNVLLVPYGVGGSKLSAIEEFYKGLIKENRLFVPARVLREFVKNRDAQLAKILQQIRNKSSEAKYASPEIPNFLKGSPEATAVINSGKEVQEALRAYKQSVDALATRILQWRGDDPVTAIYQRLFQDEIIVEHEGDKKTVATEWSARLRKQTPPGYKDANKPDTGIGDYLIWLSILALGRNRQQNLIFVSGEEKPDWCVPAGNEGVFPRPELVDEYRRASNGKSFRIAKLAEILGEMQAPDDVVSEVRGAEDLVGSDDSKSFGSGVVQFDYSTHDGRIVVEAGLTAFTLQFSKASNTAIYIYQSSDVPAIARVKNLPSGAAVAFEDFDHSSRVYTIHTGEAFLARHFTGAILAGRIDGITDDSRGDERDCVTFSFRTFDQSEKIFLP